MSEAQIDRLKVRIILWLRTADAEKLRKLAVFLTVLDR